MEAASAGHDHVLRVLLDHGCDATVTTYVSCVDDDVIECDDKVLLNECEEYPSRLLVR
jgi:hypothetical protein